MYTAMKRYSAAAARQHLSDVLDLAEAGEPVTIERKGVRFVVVAETPKRATRVRKLFSWMDEVVASGQWTWARSERGVTVRARRKK
jgi:antitoxin (DNA-binding transcriptional repressor) of toxin-antitoxin stability system